MFKGIFLWSLIFLIIIIVIFNREDKMLREIKRRYNIFADHLRFHEKYSNLCTNRSIITGMKKKSDTIAYNVNKGYEIYIAIDNESDVNSAMYVLIHEMAHNTVAEYDHSKEFWSNFKELRQIASTIGIYAPIQDSMYCGQNIKDSLL